jgi:sugar fermentation stimulation protein A
MAVKLLELTYDAEGIFKARPNRFLGVVDIIDQKTGRVTSRSVQVHVHDPGRLKEILYPGNRVLLKKAKTEPKQTRKTKWDIIAGRVNKQWVVIHSGYHRKIVESILNNTTICPFGKLKSIRPEVRFGRSRLDFLITKRSGEQVYIEVKGCTLAIDDVALFPDAPTQRGSRHLEELIRAKKDGFQVAVIILVFRSESKCFAPNGETDPRFEKTFKKALKSGVEVYPIILGYSNNSINFQRSIPICSKAR